MTMLSIRLIQWCASSLLLLAPGLALAQQHLLVADEGTSAVGYESQLGRVLTYICPSKLNTSREIWGTDIYMYESPICTAAVHAGVFTPGASGQVTIVIGPGAKLFEGTERNGVKSSSYGPRHSTYSFIKNGEPGEIEWYTKLDRVPDDFHAPLTLFCPPKGHADWYVWGTDVYTSSSAICVAAVHAGAITLDAGGRVTVTLQPKQAGFKASTRNGVLTQSWTAPDWQSFGQPFKVAPGAIDITVPASAPTSSSPSSGPRTIKTSGFTAVGSAPVIVPRTIQTAGFTGVGSAPVVIPRSIRVDGWTGAGPVKKTLRR